MQGLLHRDSVSNSWAGRDGAGLLELNGNVYMLGGWNPTVPAWGASGTTNEVWIRPKGRQKWIRLTNAPWSPRHAAVWLVHKGEIWVLGGDVNSGNYQKDVWKAKPHQGGLRWELVNAVAPWAATGRTLHVGFSFHGKIVILGGQTLDEFITNPANKANRASPYYDDVWTWDEENGWELNSTGHAWSPCGVIMGSPVKDGKMWLIGGGAYDTAGLPRVYKNSVYSSDNISDWNLVTSNAGFAARQFNNTAVFGEKLVNFAGWNGANMRDLWSSDNGIDWKESRGLNVSIRHAASLCPTSGEMLMLGGPLAESSVYGIR